MTARQRETKGKLERCDGTVAALSLFSKDANRTNRRNVMHHYAGINHLMNASMRTKENLALESNNSISTARGTGLVYVM